MDWGRSNFVRGKSGKAMRSQAIIRSLKGAKEREFDTPEKKKKTTQEYRPALKMKWH